MITPRFELTQTATEVVITVHAPYTNIKDAEIYVDETDFRFFSTPYYLRLKLPGEIVEDDLSSGSYDCEKGIYVLKFSKVTKGEFFKNLDMITSLLVPSKKQYPNIPNIEVINNPSASLVDENSEDTAEEEKDLQNVNLKENSVKPIFLYDDRYLIGPSYGFANRISGALEPFEASWLKDILDFPDPDKTDESIRKPMQEYREKKDFNKDHYVADFMLFDCAEHVLYTAEWDTLEKDVIAFNQSEADLLKELPNKEYLLEAEDISKLGFNIVDILYASCYNHRTTMGENTVESCWTINKLSSTLCWFRNFTSMDEVIIACFRRSLCYPLYRNWKLCMKIFEDVKKVLELGKKYVIKRFCEIHMLFNNSYEPRYILNELYIKDFLIWLQSSPESFITSLRTLLDDIHPQKEQIKFNLIELEAGAYSGEIVINNGIDLTGIINDMDKLELDKKGKKKKTEKEKLSGSSSSSTDSSDTDNETDSGNCVTKTSTSGSTSSTSSVNNLDSDDFSNSDNDSNIDSDDSSDSDSDALNNSEEVQKLPKV